jgi:tRNA1(Val) A37 N6-methylase TrmN6
MSESVTLQSTLKDAGNHIEAAINDVPERLEEEIESWIELHGLERLDNPYQVLARQSALNLLLKATLYEHYRINTHGTDLLELDVSTARDRFRIACESTGDDAFSEYLLDELAWTTPTTKLVDLIEANTHLLDAAEPAETIGELFEQITPQEPRRKLGQFRTPPEVASLMAMWCVQDSDDTVLDPGMGAGALSAASYKRKQELSSDASLVDIHGIDLDELALVMSATTLRLLDHGGPHNLQIGDFLNLTPDDIDGEADVVISNPPYTRHHALSDEYKTRVNTQVEHELGRDVSALSSMYAYFYYHASKFLTPAGRASYITPSEFLETGYGESLKQYLVDEFDIKALVLFDRDEDSVFDEAMTTSLISFLETPNADEPDELTRFIKVDEFPGEDVLMEAITDGVEGKTDWGFVNVVRQDDLDVKDKWTEIFDPLDVDTSQLTSLAELATVNRGIATGANSFFCLTQNEVEEWGIEKEYLSPLVRNSRSVPTYDYRSEDWEQQRDVGDEVWLLYHLEELDWNGTSCQKNLGTGDDTRLDDFTTGKASDDSDDQEQPNVVEYLQHGMSDDVQAHDSYLARNREPWYVVDRRDPAPVLVTYMSRGGCRFILNESSARNLNNLHGIYLDVELTDSELKALLAYLNSEFADNVVRRSGRTYSTGMDKIEPNELEGVPVLDPQRLDGESVTELAMLFDELRESARKDEESIDSVVAKIDARLEQELEQGD